MRPKTGGSTVLTGYAAVCRVEVRREVLRTGFGSDEEGIGDTDFTMRQTGADGVHVGQHIDLTPDVTVVPSDTSAECHSTENGSLHQNHLVVSTLCHE